MASCRTISLVNYGSEPECNSITARSHNKITAEDSNERSNDSDCESIDLGRNYSVLRYSDSGCNRCLARATHARVFNLQCSDFVVSRRDSLGPYHGRQV